MSALSEAEFRLAVKVAFPGMSPVCQVRGGTAEVSVSDKDFAALDNGRQKLRESLEYSSWRFTEWAIRGPSEPDSVKTFHAVADWIGTIGCPCPTERKPLFAYDFPTVIKRTQLKNSVESICGAGAEMTFDGTHVYIRQVAARPEILYGQADRLIDTLRRHSWITTDVQLQMIDTKAVLNLFAEYRGD